MNKNTAMWVGLIAAGASAYDLMTTPAGGTAGDLYGPGKPLESMRWKVYTRPATTTPAAPAKDYYVSITDAVALVAAFYYFK